MRASNRLWPLFWVLSVGACVVVGRRDDFDPNNPDGTDSKDAAISSEAGTGIGGDGQVTCRGLECQKAECAGQPKTSLKGKVSTPDGKITLYNAAVYIPSAELPEIQHGAVCERCGSVALSPIASAITNERGEFVLEDVPSGEIPVVVQVGKWRREIIVNVTDDCAENSAGNLTLPRNKGEGSLPKIAVAAGNEDPIQCLLRRIGVDDSEFTAPSGDGMIHLFNSDGRSSARLGGSLPNTQDTLWNDQGNLNQYDMLLLACTGWSDGRSGDPQARMDSYLAEGGRVFATHYHSLWFRGSSAFSDAAEWGGNDPADGSASTHSIDTSFPKGAAFSEWLKEQGATSDTDRISLSGVGKSVRAPKAGAQRWIYNDSYSQFITFNAPLGAAEEEQCGRAVVSDLHVSSSAGYEFMNACGSGELSAQEKALLFLIMDLSSCVEDDRREPEPPR